MKKKTTVTVCLQTPNLEKAFELVVYEIDGTPDENGDCTSQYRMRLRCLEMVQVYEDFGRDISYEFTIEAEYEG